MEYKQNEQGKCPLCGDEELNYDVSDFVENDVVYPWDCPNCGAEGKEFYTLEFSSHGQVRTKDGTEIENSDGY